MEAEEAMSAPVVVESVADAAVEPIPAATEEATASKSAQEPTIPATEDAAPVEDTVPSKTPAETAVAPPSSASTPRCGDSASQPNIFTLVQAAANGATPAPSDGQLHSARSHRSMSTSQNNTPRSGANTSRSTFSTTSKNKRGGLTGLPPRKTAASDTPRSAVNAPYSSAAPPTPGSVASSAANPALFKLDMREDAADDDAVSAAIARELLANEDEESEWETEDADAPSFAELYAAAEAASKTGPTAKSNKAGQVVNGSQDKSCSVFGFNLLEHFDRSTLLFSGAVLGVTVASCAVLAIRARWR